MASRDGSLWIAERRALIHLEPTGMSFYAAGRDLPGSSPTSLFEDSRGRLWVGVDGGLAWREHGRFFQLRMPDGSDVGLVRAMAEDRDGNLWVATVDPSRPLVRVRDGRVVEVVSAERFGGRAGRRDRRGSSGWCLARAPNAELKRYRNGRIEAHGSVGDPSRRRIHNLLPDARGLWVVTKRGARSPAPRKAEHSRHAQRPSLRQHRGRRLGRRRVAVVEGRVRPGPDSGGRARRLDRAT